MDIQGEVLTLKNPRAFEQWLKRNHDKTSFVWLRMYKKASGKTSITYDEALEVALCYGWIDGIVKKYDADSYVQRFTPRTKRSNWSKRNTQIVGELIKSGRMQPSGMREVEAAKADGRWDAAYASPVHATIPDDFLLELAKNAKAHAFFQTLNKSNKFFIAYHLATAKKPETQERRKAAIIAHLERQEKFY